LKLFLHLIPFLLPFAVYAGIVLLSRRATAEGRGWADAPWFWLAASGLALVVAGFVAVGLTSGGSGSYAPAEFRDGRVVPGRLE